jgi:hypothetical protein
MNDLAVHRCGAAGPPIRSPTNVDYNGSFQSAVAALKRERRYRVFADLERKVGQFPHALWNGPSVAAGG